MIGHAGVHYVSLLELSYSLSFGPKSLSGGLHHGLGVLRKFIKSDSERRTRPKKDAGKIKLPNGDLKSYTRLFKS